MPVPPALAAGVTAAILPDLDAFLWLIDLRLYYEWHRVLTHTVFTLPIIALVAALAGTAVNRMRPRRTNELDAMIAPARFSRLSIVAGVSLLLHLSLDFLCDFPLRLLWPFTRHDFALYLVSYSHPAFALGFAALTVALLYPLARPRPGPRL